MTIRHMHEGEGQQVLARVDQGLRSATELYDWWVWAEQNNIFHRTPVVRQLGSTNTNYTFLSEAPLKRGLLPVIGLVQDLFYDRPKVGSSFAHTQAEWYRAQVQEFAMNYFMRVSTSREFWRSINDPDKAKERESLDPFDYQGWGYYQLFYKLQSTGKIGKFPVGDRFKIVDLREIGKKYEWIVLKIRFFDFIFRRALAGASGPRLEVPVQLDNFVVINSDFVINRDNPEEGVLGEYGFGTPVVPVSDPNSILAYGPSSLSEAFQFIIFRVLSSGEVRVRLILVANQPTHLINVDPVEWGFNFADALSFGAASRFLAPLKNVLGRVPLPRMAPLFTFAGLANSFTGGVAEEQLCVSREQIYRDVMATHYFALYQFISQTLSVWDSASDWLDKKNLPKWIIEGSQPRESPTRMA